MKPPGIYPSKLPTEIINDPKRNAEVQVYDALKDLSENGFHVFYSCFWLDNRENPVPSGDGEADFVIAHPDYGVLTIEVKGGRIGRDGDTGEWYRLVTGGRRKRIKDPVAQARNSKHVILEYIKANWKGEQKPFIRMKHGVVFPNSKKPESITHFGASMPLWMFAFEENMSTLAGYLAHMLLSKEGPANRNPGKLGQQGIKILHKLFTASFELETSLESALDAYDQRIADNTEEQARFLTVTTLQKKALILGGAGTGKTHLAIAKAKQFSKEGLKTLVLYFNAPIAQDVGRRLHGAPNVAVKTFHQMCTEAATKAGISIAAGTTREKFAETLPNALAESLSGGFANTYDAIVVDEAQDLEDDWLELCMLCLKDLSTGRFFVFADDNQNLYKKQNALESLLNVEAHALTKNVRNTSPIFKFSNSFYSGITNSASAFEGPDIDFIECEGSEIGEGILLLLSQLNEAAGIPYEKIAVLSCVSREKSGIAEALSEISVDATSPPTTGKVCFDSVWRFKGLERQVVIVTEPGQASTNKELLYVAMSRARTLLIVFGQSSELLSLSQIANS